MHTVKDSDINYRTLTTHYLPHHHLFFFFFVKFSAFKGGLKCSTTIGYENYFEIIYSIKKMTTPQDNASNSSFFTLKENN